MKANFLLMKAHIDVKLKPEKKKSGLNGIRAHDLCDTDAVLHRLSYQAIWELVTL